MPPSVPVAYRPPFAFDSPCWVNARPPGESILDIVRSVPNLPPTFMRQGYVCINGEIVPREMWAYVRPKPARADLHVAVTLHVALHGGGGGGGSTKSIIGLVAALALVVVTAGIATGALIPAALAESVAGFGFLGLTGAQVLAGAVGIAGALAISALTAPPVAAAGVDTPASINSEQAEAAAASGNVLDRGGSIPRVIGTRKCFPPMACEPVVELVDQDEYVEALFVLNGPHLLEDIRIEGNAIADAEDIEYETKEGWSTDTAVELVQRQGRTITPQLELSTHSLQSNGTYLTSQSLPDTSLPVWHGVTSRNSPDEIWLHLLFPGGIYGAASNFPTSFPLRIRFRARGDTTWINVPEIHVAQQSTNQFRAAILFKWATADPIPEPPSSTGFWYANLDVPPQTTTPATPSATEWDANSYFDDGVGNVYVYNGNASSTRIRNIALYDNRVEIFLDEGTFPKGMYEIQIKRGFSYNTGAFNGITYALSATVYDFFWYYTSGGIHQLIQSHANISDRTILSRVVSIWNEDPITTPGGFALIAVKALNRSVRQLSVQASGYVKDWGGSAWDTWTTTSNPAPHYIDVLSGTLNLDPLPEDLRDDDGLVDWRTFCASYNWTCDAIVNDTRVQDTLNLLASCGYARPYQSDIYGVIVDNDRTDDDPVQIFSRRNCANLRYEKSFARLPAGFNVTYRDESLDDDQAQLTVYPSDLTNTDLTSLESISYDGLIDINKVETRARFDLDQASARSTFYYLDCDIESIVCRRGSLIGVEHDILTSRAGDGYIKSKQLGAGSPIQITGVTLDAEIPITNETEWFSLTDVFTVTDVFLVGITTGIVIRRTDGTLSTHTLSNVTGSTNVLTFATPFSDVATIQGYDDNDRRYGCLVVAGDIGSIYRRLLVQSIQPQQDLTATMVLVDEAPNLLRYGLGQDLTAMDGSTDLTAMDGSTDLETMA